MSPYPLTSYYLVMKLLLLPFISLLIFLVLSKAFLIIFLTCACRCIYNMNGDDMGNDKNALACGKSLCDSIDISFYKTLFDPVRSDILIYLVSHGKKNIKEISENFSQDRSVISKHLDLMHRYGIVLKEKRDRRIYYEADSRFVVEQFEKTTVNLKELLLLSNSSEQQDK